MTNETHPEIENTMQFTKIGIALKDWPSLSESERLSTFNSMSEEEAQDFFDSLDSNYQADLFEQFDRDLKRRWANDLAYDDLADILQLLNYEQVEETLSLLAKHARVEVMALMAYAEDVAGGLMNSNYIRLRANMMVEEAIRYIRTQTLSNVETIYYTYVIDTAQKLVGVVSLRELFGARDGQKISELMTTGDDLIAIPDNMDQEEIGRVFSRFEQVVLPVVDEEFRMKGIITIDDIIKAVEEETTEDMQKIAAVESLDAPYLEVGFFEMTRKRLGWLVILFIGQMLTATAMTHFEAAIAHTVALVTFIPLIISSGGNSGAQASTLVIRALALGEVKNSDSLRVFLRELGSGLFMGFILGIFGFMRIYFWPHANEVYGVNFASISLIVGCSIICIVMWGTLVGSMLPFLLKKLRFDPATASTPFVATICDVTGIIIYFSIAHALL
ncbi:magnesium transporter [Halobacteriovorax sp. RZ-2]|uniref:magnesium transporter n=1 Tax=unclassified Halobacteriovorax TaxID=2639665 RepID=UPI00372055E6